jgi:hypothetical protein
MVDFDPNDDNIFQKLWNRFASWDTEVQEVRKKKVHYTGSNVRAKGPPPLLLYAVRSSHALGGKFFVLAVRFWTPVFSLSLFP